MKTSSDDATAFKTIPFTWPKGYKSDGVHAGLRQDKKDMGWIYSEVPAQAAGTYTTNQIDQKADQSRPPIAGSYHEFSQCQFSHR